VNIATYQEGPFYEKQNNFVVVNAFHLASQILVVTLIQISTLNIKTQIGYFHEIVVSFVAYIYVFFTVFSGSNKSELSVPDKVLLNISCHASETSLASCQHHEWLYDGADDVTCTSTAKVQCIGEYTRLDQGRACNIFSDILVGNW
jgi:hypothetical protein